MKHTRNAPVSNLALAALAAALVLAPPMARAQTAGQSATVRQLMSGAAFKRATAALEIDHDRWVQDIVTLTEIPAPPFKEAERARAFAGMLREAGLTDAAVDEVGNVLALRRGTGAAGRPVVVVSAHLDTVFPEGTDVKVRREGDRLYAPGVGDDSTGLATLLAMARAMKAADVRTQRDILFVGTVGEEGAGDLRGVRHLFSKGAYAGRIGAFFSLDGGELGRVTTGAVGSKRYRATFKGPGGHSYGAFGIVNPMAALGAATAEFYRTPVPTTPKTTFAVSVIGGGTSVNAIPTEGWMEVDMRSSDPGELAKLEGRFLQVVDAAAAAENTARSTGPGVVTVEKTLIGDRPAGRTAPGADIIGHVAAAHAVLGIPLEQGDSSTDSNIPMSLGVPAITLTRAAEGGRAHAPDEWVGVAKAPSHKVKVLALATVLATAGAARSGGRR